MEKHVVFGAELIGCYLGAAIHAKGVPVTLIGRAKFAAACNQNVLLTDFKKNQQYVSEVKFIDTKSASDWGVQAEKADIIWLTVKCTDVTQACKDMQPMVAKTTRIICCQNGLGADSLVRHRFPDNTVLRAVVPFNVAQPQSNHFHRGSAGELTIEKLTDSSLWVDKIASQIASPILPTTTCEDMEALVWAKLQLNLGNAINALANKPVKQMLMEREYRLVIASLMRELLQVTHAMSIRLPKLTAVKASWLPYVLSLPDWLFKRVANQMLAIDPTVRTSMWWDIQNGRHTEIDFLNGQIIDHGEVLGVPCPVNTIVRDLIKTVEKSRIQNHSLPSFSAKKLLKLVR